MVQTKAMALKEEFGKVPLTIMGSIFYMNCVMRTRCPVPSNKFFVMAQFCSVVVITFASHAKGPRFEPGQN